jgi:hypothetical protein
VLQGDAIATLPLRHETETHRTHRRPDRPRPRPRPRRGRDRRPAAAGAVRILRHRPADVADRKGRRIHEGRRDRRRADGRALVLDPGKAQARGLQLGGARPWRRNRRPGGLKGSALPLRHPALARLQADDAAGRHGQAEAGMEGVPERRGPTLRAGRAVLVRTRSRRRQRRRQPAPVRAGPPGRSRSAPGRSGTRPTSSTSLSPPRRAATRGWSRCRARRSKRSTRGRR